MKKALLSILLFGLLTTSAQAIAINPDRGIYDPGKSVEVQILTDNVIPLSKSNAVAIRLDIDGGKISAFKFVDGLTFTAAGGCNGAKYFTDSALCVDVAVAGVLTPGMLLGTLTFIPNDTNMLTIAQNKDNKYVLGNQEQVVSGQAAKYIITGKTPSDTIIPTNSDQTSSTVLSPATQLIFTGILLLLIAVGIYVYKNTSQKQTSKETD